ncbi:type II toxin-antitoxin system RelB/DinJ family antitoxin [Clostridium sp. OM02-18AC]|nr:type II toxin-antitoxin system RelB/DinJ family antitoxin [Clostridium sp. AF32-12BH]RHV63830.1 type II toxin-antitoxin system RelB/DinJ family antitoxin [Clostridium sp. OM02-18AC]
MYAWCHILYIIDEEVSFMEPMGIVQARTPERIKENAANILDKLGLNMSTYINMALNQLIIQEGIPFSVKLTKSSYTNAEKINEVAATLKLEGLHLDENDIQLMQEIQHGNISFEQAREKILNEV